MNPSPYLFFVRTPPFEVVGASPELLLQVEGDRLTTHPIAGTRPRGATSGEDELLAEQLQRDPRSGPSTSCSSTSAATTWAGSRGRAP